MKKQFAFLTALAVSCTMSIPAAAADAVHVNINESPLVFDVAPQIINGRTMVPMRTIFETLGASVEWNGEEKTILAKKEDTTVFLAVNKAEMQKNGETILLDSPAVIRDGRTLVPIRAVAESFDCEVLWDGSTKTVQIKTEEAPDFQLPENPTPPMQQMDHAVYAPILSAYKSAMEDYALRGAEKAKADHKDLNTQMLANVLTATTGGRSSRYVNGIYYAYADINKDGTDELLLSSSDVMNNYFAVYTLKNGRPTEIFNNTLGTNVTLTIHTDGTLQKNTILGLTQTQSTSYILKDGSLTKKDGWTTGRPLPLFDWQEIVPAFSGNHAAFQKELYGEYMNGNDDAAKLILSQGEEADGIHIRMEAFKTPSAALPEMIFEGEGTVTATGVNAVVTSFRGEDAYITFTKTEDGSFKLVMPAAFKTSLGLSESALNSSFERL